MKLAPILILASLTSAQAAVYTMNLGTAPDQSPANGVDGWVQSEANFVDGDNEVYPRSFVHSIGSSNAIALGGYYDSEPSTAPGTAISISRQLTSLGLNESNLSLDFSIQDSITEYSDGFPGDVDRNRFSIGFFDSSGDALINLIFSPNSQSTDPSAQTNATWNMLISSGANSFAPFGAVFEGDPTLGGVYSLSLSTTESATAGAVDFNLSIFSGSNVQNTSGTLAGRAGSQIDRLTVGWDVAGDETDGLGTNFIAFNNVAVVPEPSGLVLCMVSSLPLLMRRRRARL
jgi:hypothetical protein